MIEAFREFKKVRDEVDDHVNPIGVKGIGEIGITGAAAAIANAIFNATGVRVRELPITLDKLLGGIPVQRRQQRANQRRALDNALTTVSAVG